jgi:hypothetical protein
MRIQISELFDAAVVVDDRGSEEVLELACTEGRAPAVTYVPAEAPPQHFHGFPIIETDARCPYVVFIAGVPAFAAPNSRWNAPPVGAGEERSYMPAELAAV